MRAARAVIVAAAAMALSVVPIRPLRKSNRARRHRLNPGRRAVVDRKAGQVVRALGKIATGLAGFAKAAGYQTDPKWAAQLIADAHAPEGKGT